MPDGFYCGLLPLDSMNNDPVPTGNKMRQATNALEALWLEACDCTEATGSEDCTAHIKMVEVQNYIQALEQDHRSMQRALEKLSTLGNGELKGNSDGNVIAQRAISSLTLFL